MLILGIETSCDECSASVVRDGNEVLTNIVASQVDLHREYGGVVPEIAARAHVETIIPVLDQALKVDGSVPGLIAVTVGPGLVGSLVVGVSVAKSLAWAWDVPLIGVNHVEAHLIAPVLEKKTLEFPFVGLVVSGGHTLLADVTGFDRMTVVGETLDDAVGEAYDKISNFLGLGYPGGPVIDRISKDADPDAIFFPRPMIKSGDCNFSMSGLKTAVVRHVEKIEFSGKSVREDPRELADIAASFQAAACEVIVEKTIRAVRLLKRRRVMAGGGVVCNSELRRKLTKACIREGIELFLPSPVYCTDNAAMIASLGYYLYEKGYRCGNEVDVYPGLKVGETIPGCEKTD